MSWPSILVAARSRALQVLLPSLESGERWRQVGPAPPRRFLGRSARASVRSFADRRRGESLSLSCEFAVICHYRLVATLRAFRRAVFSNQTPFPTPRGIRTSPRCPPPDEALEPPESRATFWGPSSSAHARHRRDHLVTMIASGHRTADGREVCRTRPKRDWPARSSRPPSTEKFPSKLFGGGKRIRTLVPRLFGRERRRAVGNRRCFPSPPQSSSMPSRSPRLAPSRPLHPRIAETRDPLRMGEAQPFRRQSIEVGSADLAAVAADIGPSRVVAQDRHDGSAAARPTPGESSVFWDSKRLVAVLPL